jgi:enoyl-CoA hydratase/carnithine racemase
MNDRVRIDIDANGVADVCLARPDKMNTLDSAMFSGLLEAVVSLRKERRLRAVVPHGEGHAFCAGRDMANFAGMSEARTLPSSTTSARAPTARPTLPSTSVGAGATCP